MKSLAPTLCVALAVSGCATLSTEMVDSASNVVNCQSSGGGIGVGAVVGLTSAALSRNSCVSTLEAKGYMKFDEAGTIPLKWKTTDAGYLIESTNASELKAGDVIVEVDGKKPATGVELRQALFGKLDAKVNVKVVRDNAETLLVVARKPFNKPNKS